MSNKGRKDIFVKDATSLLPQLELIESPLNPMEVLPLGSVAIGSGLYSGRDLTNQGRPYMAFLIFKREKLFVWRI